MKIVHAADLHIDSPLRGLARLGDAPVDEFRTATRRAFDRLVDTCLDEGASLLLLAGDIFDGDLRDWDSVIHFNRALGRLREGACRVVMVRGNHDAESNLSRTIRSGEHVYVLPHRRADSLTFDDLGVAVHGQSFATRAVTENLARAYPPRIEGLCNFGLLHTNAIGSTAHDNYAPCTVEDLAGLGYEYWALGHVHARQVLGIDPWVVYPGNLQGRHARETGAKGCSIVDIRDGRVAGVEHRDLDVVRWECIAIDAGPAATFDSLLNAAARSFREVRERDGDRPVAARVCISGSTILHHELAGRGERLREELASCAADAGAIWIEKIAVETRRITAGGAAGEAHPLRAVLDAELAGAAADPGLAAFRELLEPLARKVGRHVDARLDGEEFVHAALRDAAAWLAARLEIDEGAARP